MPPIDRELHWHHYCGAHHVLQGIDDLHAGIRTESSLLIAEARPRLQDLGLVIPVFADTIAEPHMQLWFLLQQVHGLAAASRYNALMREIVSFANTWVSVGSTLWQTDNR